MWVSPQGNHILEMFSNTILFDFEARGILTDLSRTQMKSVIQIFLADVERCFRADPEVSPYFVWPHISPGHQNNLSQALL